MIPREFAELLTAAGRRVLDGKAGNIVGALSDPKRRFIALSGLVVKSKAEALRRELERAMPDKLRPLERPIPPETIWGMKRDYEEWLPKTVRVRTALLENKRDLAYRQARDMGLIDLLSSESFVAFAERVAGRALDRKGGQQLLCYGPGDYSGPHNDHHPENKRAAKGYIDIHLSLAGPAVKSQYLVYAKKGHLTEMVPVHAPGTITVYRLPLWHYTTPLVAKSGQADKARRWVLLGTFLFAGRG